MEDKKIILQMSTTYQASPGRIMEDLQRIGESKGYKMVGAVGRGSGSFDHAFIQIGSQVDLYKHVARTRFLDQHGLGSRKATVAFIEDIRDLNPDVIHLHNIHGYYLNFEVLFSYLKEAGKPVIWTLHDCWPFTGHCAYFDYAGCECWKLNGEHHCIQKREYPTSWIKNNSKDNFLRKQKAFTGLKNLTIVTPSNWLAKLVEQSMLKEYPVKVIPNGVHLEVFRPLESQVREKYKLNNRFVILGVASVWDKRKGYIYFEELSKRLSSDEVIVLVGLTAQQINQLPSNIVGISRTNSVQELAEIYSAADVFVNPTLEDNFPTTNLEALACGTPVITFDTGGSPEAIDEKTGLVTKYKTVDSILEALQDMKRKPLKRENCRERGEFFSKERMFAQYEQLLENKLL